MLSAVSYDSLRNKSSSIAHIGFTQKENIQELLGAPIQILNVKNTQKNLKFGDIKPGLSIYSRVKFHEKIPENVSVAKEILSEQKSIQTVFFSIHRKFLSFLPRICFLVFFHEISRGSRSGPQV